MNLQSHEYEKGPFVGEQKVKKDKLGWDERNKNA